MNPITYLVDNMMIPILKFFYNLTGNYGWSIVLLTVSIKMALLPFTAKQVSSMAGLKEIQPKMKELQEKHKKDPQQLQIKMMQLYKDHNVNPFGSCLPTLIQLPFFIAIFVSLNSLAFKELTATGSSFFWLASLSEKDGTMILPILVAASTWLSQKTMSVGNADDPTTKMFAYMPIFMLFIALPMPSGVLIYWALSQFMTGAQQYLLSKKKPENKKGA